MIRNYICIEKQKWRDGNVPQQREYKIYGWKKKKYIISTKDVCEWTTREEKQTNAKRKIWIIVLLGQQKPV